MHASLKTKKNYKYQEDTKDIHKLIQNHPRKAIPKPPVDNFV